MSRVIHSITCVLALSFMLACGGNRVQTTPEKEDPPKTPGTDQVKVKIDSGLAGTIDFVRSSANYQELIYAQKDMTWSEGEVIFMRRQGVTDQQMQNEVASVGGEVVARKHNSPYYLVRSRRIKTRWKNCIEKAKEERASGIPTSYEENNTQQELTAVHRESAAFIQTFKSKKKLFYNVFPNYIRKASSKINPRQWALGESNMEEIWETYGKGNANIRVAVLDTGIRPSHPNLVDNLIWSEGYDFVNDELDGDENPGPDSNPDEPTSSNASFHGTHVAGIVAAKPTTGMQLDGVAGDVKILPIRVLGEEGGSDFDISQGILYAAGLLEVENGKKVTRRADIINLSLGGPGESPILEDAVRRATNAGVVVVAAAGNNGSAALSYPAAYSDVIAVGALGPSHTYASYSNHGPNVDIMAPGGGDLSTTDENGDGVADGILSSWVRPVTPPGDLPSLTFMSGTSMAAPFVAGVVALMKSVKPGITLPEIRKALFENASNNTAKPENCQNRCGRGSLDLPTLFRSIESMQVASAKIKIPQSFVLGTPENPVVKLRLANTGGGTLEMIQGERVRIHAGSSVDWLSVDATQDAQGISLTVAFDKSKIGNNAAAALVDVVTNAVEIDVGGNKNYSGVLQLTAAYETSDVVHVALVRAEDQTPLAWTYTTQSRGWGYQFELSTPGEYLVYAGKDMDKDGSICNNGDPCGIYTSLANPKKIVFSGGTVMKGLNFKVEVADHQGKQFVIPK